jgi:transposase-like protein
MFDSVSIPKRVADDLVTMFNAKGADRMTLMAKWHEIGKDPRAEFVAYVTASDEEMMCCPECGSGDISFEAISCRPYCNDCKHWGAVNYVGTSKDAIHAWNVQAILAGRG